MPQNLVQKKPQIQIKIKNKQIKLDKVKEER